MMHKDLPDIGISGLDSVCVSVNIYGLQWSLPQAGGFARADVRLKLVQNLLTEGFYIVCFMAASHF